jgi:peptidoglycan/LPS O-acetylase OafA/YrhL
MVSVAEKAQPQQRHFRPVKRLDLQGMRAFAVLAVFADHLFNWPSGGFVGVDVFFVLSGFFITSMLIRERTQTGAISYRDFYVRRVRRIIPSAVLVLAVTVAASHVLLTATRAKDATIDGLWAAVFLSNWRFERATDYFAEGQPPSPLLHYWSLSIEEQFYFAWPFLLVGLFAVTRRYSTRTEKYPAKRQLWLGMCMASICVASFAWACVLFPWNPTGAYFSTFTRIWELGVGSLLSICAPLLARIPRTVRPALSYIGLTGAVASLFVINPDSAFPGPWAALPVLSTALVVAAFSGSEVRSVPHLTNRAAVYIGEVSYTLYLWHWPVIVLLAAVLPPGAAFSAVAVSVAMALTAATYHLYENPIRRSAWLDQDAQHVLTTRQWVLAGIAAAAIVITAASVSEVRDARSSTAQENQTLVVDTAAPRFDEVDHCLGAAALTTENCARYDPDKPLYPGLDRYADDTQGAYECYRAQGEPMSSCTYGYEGGRRIAVVGDSHAAMLLPALAPYLMENQWSMTTFVGNGCRWMAGRRNGCGDAMSEIQAKLLTERYDVVIVSASRQYARGEGAVVDYVDAWRPVAEAGSKILVVADVPGVTAEALACVTRVGSNPGDCATPRDVALSKPDRLLTAAQQVPGATVLDMTDTFCDTQQCPTVIGNVIVYRDAAGHMTATYAQSLAPRLIDAVKASLAH